MSGYEYGGAMSVKTVGDGERHLLSDVPPTVLNTPITGSPLDKVSFEAKYILVTADSNNTTAVLIGPNGAAVQPLAAGQSIPIWFADPSKIAYDDQGTAGLILYIIWGAASERWFAAEQQRLVGG